MAPGLRFSSTPARHAAAVAPVARRLLSAMESADVAGVLGCFAPRAVHEIPFAPPGSPRLLDGADAIVRHYLDWFDRCGPVRFRISGEWEFGQGWALLEYHRTDDSCSDSARESDFAGLFCVEDSRIVLLREYSDPLAIREAGSAVGVGVRQYGFHRL